MSQFIVTSLLKHSLSISTITPTTHVLFYLVTPKLLSKPLAGVMTTLIRMEHNIRKRLTP